MKKLLFLIFAVSFYACEKCGTCTITTTTEPYYTESVATFEACGSDIKEVNGSVVTYTTQGITATAVTKCR